MLNGRIGLTLPDNTQSWTTPLTPPLVVSQPLWQMTGLPTPSEVSQFSETGVYPFSVPLAETSAPSFVPAQTTPAGASDLPIFQMTGLPIPSEVSKFSEIGVYHFSVPLAETSAPSFVPAQTTPAGASDLPISQSQKTPAQKPGTFAQGFNWMAGNLSKMEMLFINSTLSLGLATLFRAAPDVLALGVASASPELAQAVFATTDPSFDWLTLSNLSTKWLNYMEASVAISFIFNGRSALKNSFVLKNVDHYIPHATPILNWPHKAFQFFYDQKELKPDELVTHSYGDVLANNGVMGSIRKIGLTMGGFRGTTLMTGADFTFNTIISWVLAFIFESNFDPMGMLAKSSLATGLQVAANSIIGANKRFSDSEVMMHRTVIGVEKAGFYTGLSNSQALPEWAKWGAQLVYGAVAIYQAKMAVKNSENSAPEKTS